MADEKTVDQLSEQFFEVMRNSSKVTVDGLARLQDQYQKTLKTMAEQGIGIQQEGLKVIDKWFDGAVRSREEFSKNLEQSIDKLEQSFLKQKAKK